MDEIDQFDEPGGLESRDLELVARLRPEPAPDAATIAQHHQQLVAAIQAAGTGPGATTAGGPPPPAQPAAASHAATPSASSGRPPLASIAAGSDHAEANADDGTMVVPFAPHPAGEAWRGPHWRILTMAAAVVVLAGGLALAALLAPARDHTATGQSPTEGQQRCGGELPLAFPAPAGFEGPSPGPSGEVSDPDSPTDALMLHWRSGETTIDVRWPSSQVIDPTTPTPPGVTTRTILEIGSTGEGRLSVWEAFHTQALGTGECSGLDVMVTAADPEGILDQIEIGLVGPGGPLAPEQPLVTGSILADTLPTVDESSSCPGTAGGPVEGSPTYPTPREALAYFEATRDPQSGSIVSYQEVALPDGSFAYIYDARPDLTTIVVHVMPSGEGWGVTSRESTPC